jgi:phosphate starvation-inducible PhoH-like protein
MTKRKTKKIILNSKDNILFKSVPLTEKQKKLVELIINHENRVTFISGPAGSSKTYIAVYSALRLLAKEQDLDLLYVRTIIESAEKGLGALPGDLNDKFNPYMIPLEEKLYELLPKNDTTRTELFSSGRVDAMPINFLRGVDWKNKIVIMDEAQNATFKELTTLITRIGENSKLIVCGDYMQSDINGKSGFQDMKKLFSDKESQDKGINTFTFTESDIKRSEIVKFIVEKIRKNSE